MNPSQAVTAHGGLWAAASELLSRGNELILGALASCRRDPADKMPALPVTAGRAQTNSRPVARRGHESGSLTLATDRQPNAPGEARIVGQVSDLTVRACSEGPFFPTL